MSTPSDNSEQFRENDLSESVLDPQLAVAHLEPHDNGNQEEANTSSPDNNRLSKHPTKTAKIMKETKKIPIRSIIFDIILLYACGQGFKLFCEFIGPIETGFFCNDEGIRYPYRSDTVSGNALYLYCFNIVLITVLLVEWYRLLRVDGDQGHYSEYEIGRHKINKMVVRTFIFYGYFQVAFVLTHILTNLTKISIGRLRPHFLAVCQPNITLILCPNSGLFIDAYKCLGPDPSQIREARLSFWSGHSSLSMVSSTFAVLYLQCRLHGSLPSQVLLPLLQMSIMGMGMFISYSRIYDNMHYLSDVLAGMTVGVFIATLIAVYVAKLFPTAISYEERKNLIPIPSYSAPSLRDMSTPSDNSDQFRENDLSESVLDPELANAHLEPHDNGNQEEANTSSPDNNLSKQPTKTAKIMEETKKIPIRSIIFDIILLYACVEGFTLFCEFVGPVETGFFCNDKGIRYPYRSDTVSDNALYLYCFNIVLITVLLVEWYRLSRVDGDQGHYSEYEIGRHKINKMIVRIFIFYGYFQVAYVLTDILTNLTKISAGRLRPHFLAVCQPNITLTSCQNSGLFIDAYKCLGPDLSQIREARLSFWSGHSSLSMVSSTFAVLYLQCRLHGLLPSQVLLPLLQMSIMGMGMFISYSRIYDNMHYLSDVLAGMTVGVFVATLIAVYIAKLFSTAIPYEERKNIIPIPSYSAPSLVKISKQRQD